MTKTVGRVKVGLIVLVVFVGVALLLSSGCSFYYDKAYQEGYEAGKSAGYSLGFQDGLSKGRDEGYDVGNYDGYWTGYELGHDDGLASCDLISITSWPSSEAREWRDYWRDRGICDKGYSGALPYP